MLALVDSMFCEFHLMGGKAVFRAAAIAEVLERVRMDAMTYKLYTAEPEAEEVEEEEAEDEAPIVGLAGDPPEERVTKEEEAARVKRLDEESRCQEILRRADWLARPPIHHAATYSVQEAQLLRECTQFVDRFQSEACRMMSGCAGNLRMLTVETRWTFQYLCEKGWLPRNLTQPHDRYIRAAASATCGPEYQDPGNLCFDVVFHVLSLDRFVLMGSHDRVMRTVPGEYGERSNKSARGTVNLRGNVIEAILGDFQRMGSVREVWRPAAASLRGPQRAAQGWRGGSSSASSSWWRPGSTCGTGGMSCCTCRIVAPQQASCASPQCTAHQYLARRPWRRTALGTGARRTRALLGTSRTCPVQALTDGPRDRHAWSGWPSK